ASIADMISQLMMLNSYRDRELRFRTLFEGTLDAVMVIRDFEICECNPSMLTMFGSSREQLMDSSLSKLSPLSQPDGRHSEHQIETRIKAALNGTRQQFEWNFHRMDGTSFHAEVGLNFLQLGDMKCVLGTIRDVSDRKQAEAALVESQKQLAFRTSHDALTELPNRDSLHENGASLLIDAKRSGQNVAVLLLDLNRFKDVNDTLGHRIGDFILQKVARRLLTALQKSNTKSQLYRLGGDEFAVIQYGIVDQQSIMALVSTVNKELKMPMEVEGMFLEMGASIGVALYPEHGDSSHALLRCADVAMYHAKTHGETCSFYSNELDSHSTRRLTMLADLGTAIRENQLQLYYQPRIDIKTGACNGCEALLRWDHPLHGMVPPADFIPLAEMTEIIHPLSLWVLTSAMKQIRSWMDQGKEIAIAVNLSARNLIDIHCPSQVKSLLEEFDVPHRLLEIEITESALITDPHRAMQVVEEFHKLGIHLAIDDFGTGYSSMSYLKRLPIQTLKIDRSFVKDMLSDDADAVIVRSTIGLAHSFGLNVVAEGVEDEPTLMVLRNLQCEQAQGYHICRPVPVADFDAWYDARLN
ncbi:putative bifunctional diguanylate cyclase/phosphodiesterase, partial [Ketobacter sp.]